MTSKAYGSVTLGTRRVISKAFLEIYLTLHRVIKMLHTGVMHGHWSRGTLLGSTL